MKKVERWKKCHISSRSRNHKGQKRSYISYSKHLKNKIVVLVWPKNNKSGKRYETQI